MHEKVLFMQTCRHYVCLYSVYEILYIKLDDVDICIFPLFIYPSKIVIIFKQKTKIEVVF